MSEFSKGKWRADYEENKYIWSSKDKVLGELYFTTPEETKANARLIAAAPEMYGLLKTLSQRIEENEAEILGVMKMPFTKTRKGVSVDKDNSSYWEVKSFFNFSETKALLARIDGEDE